MGIFTSGKLDPVSEEGLVGALEHILRSASSNGQPPA
jgi:hypothetical protein